MKLIDLIIKEVKVLLFDKTALIIIILMPAVLMTILGAALKGVFMSGEGSEFNFKIAIVKEYDMQEETDSFIDEMLKRSTNGDVTSNDMIEAVHELNIEKFFFSDFLGSKDLKKIIEYEESNKDNAYDLLEAGKVDVIVILPEGFVYNMYISMMTQYRNITDIEIIGHPDRSFNYDIVSSIMDSFFQGINMKYAGKQAGVETLIEFSDITNMNTIIEKVSESLKDTTKNIKVEFLSTEVTGKKPVDAFSYYAAAMTCMFILYTSAFGGRLLLAEKEEYTLHRLLVAGISEEKILFIKTIAVFAMCLIQMGILFIYTKLVLKINWGNPASVILIVISASIGVAGLSTLLMAITYRSGNYSIANAFQGVAVQLMALLGGSYLPLDILPKIFKKLSFLSINGVALQGFLNSMRGYEINSIYKYVLINMGIGMVVFILGVVVFKWGNKKCLQ